MTALASHKFTVENQLFISYFAVFDDAVARLKQLIQTFLFLLSCCDSLPMASIKRRCNQFLIGNVGALPCEVNTGPLLLNVPVNRV